MVFEDVKSVQRDNEADERLSTSPREKLPVR